MLYATLDSLLNLFSRIDLKDSRSMAALGALVKVYHNAASNPPEGVIGVGVITYAENALIDFQLSNPEALDDLADALEAWESEAARRAAEARLAYHDETDTLDLY